RLDAGTYPRNQPTAWNDQLERAVRSHVWRFDRDADLPRQYGVRYWLLGRLKGYSTWQTARRCRIDLGRQPQLKGPDGAATLPRRIRVFDRPSAWADVLQA